MYSKFIKLIVLVSLLVCCGFAGRVLYGHLSQECRTRGRSTSQPPCARLNECCRWLHKRDRNVWLDSWVSVDQWSYLPRALWRPVAKERKDSRIWRRWAGSQGFSPDNVRYNQSEYGRMGEILLLDDVVRVYAWWVRYKFKLKYKAKKQCLPQSDKRECCVPMILKRLL